jgi:helicase SWR1
MLIYEEFMARSSTRQALRKGGNFMGMMNVLMQLRKVCNHPDLFEPRSVVTPFVVEPITIQVPHFVHSPDPLHFRVSDYLLAPIWSGSQGEPSVHNCLKHDRIESDELLEFEHSLPSLSQDCVRDMEDYELVPYSMQLLGKQLLDRKHKDKLANVKFLNTLNRQRCSRRPSIVTDRLLSVVAVGKESSNVVTTPDNLLALRKDQRQRSNELNGLIKKFVFCVPKVGAAHAVMKRKDTIEAKRTNCLNEMLQEPVRQFLLPFREASAKLASDFPDKNLIQFDAGKLQVLASLLRERKQGGHKVLIFTQMGKMVRHF